MKIPSDDVFLLIKALSPSEKRYFTTITLAKESGKNNAYYKLFLAMDEQEEYDEQVLLKKYARQKFAKNLPTTKQYLQNLLLKSLCAYYATNSTYKEISEKIDAANILHNKGLFAMSKKLMSTARKQAEQHEYFYLAALAMRYEILNITPQTTTNHEAELRHLYKRLGALLDILQREREYLFLHGLTLSSFLSTTYQREDDAQFLQEIVQHPLLQENNKPKETVLRTKYHSALSRSYFIMGDYHNAYRHAKAEIAAFEEIPVRMRESQMYYLAQLHNLFSRSLKVQRYEELYPIIQKIRAVPSTTLQIQKFKYESLFSLEISYFFLAGEFERAIALTHEIEQVDAQLHDKVRQQHRITLFFNVLIAHMYTGDYATALVYANRIINHPPVLQQLYSMCKILAIIIHSELGNYDILDAVIRSAYRHLQKQGHLFEMEKIILRSFRKLGSIVDNTTLQQFLQQLRAELQEVAQNPKEARVLEYFHFIHWIDAKLAKKTVADIWQPIIQYPTGAQHHTVVAV